MLYDLIDHGYILIPLYGKRPAIPWQKLINNRPTPECIEAWFASRPDAEIGLLTGPLSGVICLDCDAPPYPDGYFTPTPSGGRHYFYPWHDGDRHGLNVTPNHDIPYIVRLYDWPQLNPGRIPEQPSAPPNTAKPQTTWKQRPADMETLSQCAFIAWFQEQRHDPHWGGRYPLARAYASNVVQTTNPDTHLGPRYQHHDDIYNRIGRPTGCAAIVNAGFNCPHFHNDTQTCLKEPGVTTPYGLALRRHNHDRTDDGPR